MSLKIPDSMEECVYFTNRSLLDEGGKPSGKIICWVPRMSCPKCRKGWMTKPWDEKEKKFRVRASEYVCRECSYTEEKKEHEDKLSAMALFTCPSCGKQGEGTVPYARKTYQGVKAILFECGSCGAQIPVTKKLKEPKKKGGKKKKEDVEVDDDDF